MKKAGIHRILSLFGRSSKSGFTLIEVFIVVPILGVLGMAAISNVSDYIVKSKITEVMVMGSTAADPTLGMSVSSGYDSRFLDMAAPTGSLVRYDPGSDDGYGNLIVYELDEGETYVTRDIDNDGADEIVSFTYLDGQSNLSVKEFESKTPVELPQTALGGVTRGVAPDDFFVADVSGDGNLDVVVTASGFRSPGDPPADARVFVEVFLGDGTGHLVRDEVFSVNYTNALLRNHFAIADMNSDGDEDLLFFFEVTPGNFTYLIFENTTSAGVTSFQGLAIEPPAAPAAAFAEAVPSDMAALDASLTDTSMGSLSGLLIFDINDDGFLDALITVLDNDQILVMLNDPAGGLLPPANVPTGDGPVAVAAADVNIDGFTDLITGNSLGDDISVLLGDGAMNFAAPISSPTGGAGLRTMGLHDFNLDGCIDVFVGSTQDRVSDMRILPGNCSGVFGELAVGLGGVAYPTGPEPVSVSLGDVDGDGDNDVMVTNRADRSFTIFKNNGRGSFATSTQFFFSGDALNIPRTGLLVDMDNDGDLDALNIASRSIHCLRNDGTGDYSGTGYLGYKWLGYTAPAGASIAVGDVDGDGYPDVVTHTDTQIVVIYGAGGVDMDGNGDDDFFDPYRNPLIINAGTYRTGSVALGDVDGDTDLDIVTANRGLDTPATTWGDIRVMYNVYDTSPGTGFVQGPLIAVDDESTDVALGDLNGDGILDAVTANYNQWGDDYYSVSALMGTGDGNFVLDYNYDAGDWGKKVILIDAEGDGDLDVFVHSTLAPYGFAITGAHMLQGDGSGTLWLPTPLLPGAVTDMAVGDLNGNNDVDMVTIDSSTNEIEVWMSSLNPCPAPSTDADGDGVCGDVDNCPADQNPTQVDSDGDGAGDVCDSYPYDPADDSDGDGVGGEDNCPYDYNPSQIDSDGDGDGDICDPYPNDPDNDIDSDGVSGNVDNCPATANPGQTDGDGDGLGDLCDGCPADPANDSDGDEVCGDVDNCSTTSNSGQTDSDSDGVGDSCDACPNDPDNDSDADAVCGDVDNCPATANDLQADSDSDGVGDLCDAFPLDSDDDIDGDGISGEVDNCPDTANAGQVDSDGDGIGDDCDACVIDPDNDLDGDGICGDVDNCLATANSGQSDADGDGVGDVCDAFPFDHDDDIDGDGLGADVDNCPATANAGQADSDSDGTGDACDNFPLDSDDDIDGDGVSGEVDNCPDTANAGQVDSDGDGIGDDCDACVIDPDNDLDGDGICGDVDNCLATANSGQSDADGDGVGDVCDAFPFDHDDDIDGDGLGADVDSCPDIANMDQLDSDDDGLGDVCDACPDDADNDSDADGICGDVDNCPYTANPDQLDSNDDGVGDECVDIRVRGKCFIQSL